MLARYALAYVATGIAFALIDSVWLRTMYTRLYQPEIGSMMMDGFRLTPAIIFYLLYITGNVPHQKIQLAYDQAQRCILNHYFSAASIRAPMSAGERTICAPAVSKARNFSCAVPWPPAITAPA